MPTTPSRRPAPLAPFALALAACGGGGPEPAPPAPLLDADGRVPALRCPGDPACPRAEGRLTVGVAALEITPAIETFEDLDGDGVWDEGEPLEDADGDGVWDPVWMAGFGQARAATGVHDATWVRALTFTKGEARLGVVAIDAIGYFHDDVLAVREAARARGLGFDHVIVVATHQHEGKDTMGLWGPSPFESGYDAEYMAFVAERAAEALAQALEGARPARLVAARGDGGGFIADTRLPEVVDGDVTALRFVDDADETFATAVIYGNHPEVLDDVNTLLTSDYPHFLRESMQARWPGSVSVFLPGNLGGMMTPLHTAGCPDADGNPTCFDGDFAKAEWVGEGVAEVAIGALEGPGARTDPDPELAFARYAPLWRPGNARFVLGFGVGLVKRTLFRSDGTRMPIAEVQRVSFEDVLDGRAQLQTEVDRVRLGPLEILTVPGELYPELWLADAEGQSLAERPEGRDFEDAAVPVALSSLLPADGWPVIVNQANDALGYIIPRSQYDTEAPRAYRANGQYGEINSLGPDTAPALLEAARALYAVP